MDKIEPVALLAELKSALNAIPFPHRRGYTAEYVITVKNQTAAKERIYESVSALLSENARLRELTGGKNHALDQLVRVAAENARFREALDAANYHLASIGAPFNKRGEYDQHGEWDFSDAVPEPVNAREVKAAFGIIRAALSPQEDA